MRNRRRNRLLLGAAYLVTLGIFASVVYLAYAMSSPGRRGAVIVAAVGLGAVWVWIVWSGVRQSRDLRSIERNLRDAGLELPDEEPIPIRLAESRESLVVSLILLALIACTFIGYYGGWFGRWFGAGSRGS